VTETVSREELEALLSAYRTAHAGRRQRKDLGTRKAVRPFEAPRSGVVSTECLKALKRFHHEFAAAMSEMMSTLFRLPVKVEATNIEQVTRKGFRESITSPVMMMEVEAEPLKREIVLAIDPSLVGQWTDFVCGAGAEEPCEPSRLTEIDVALAARVAQVCLDKYAEMWPGAQKLHFETRRVCSSESYESNAAPSEEVLFCSFDVASSHCSGRLIWCLPAAAVEASLVQKDEAASRSDNASDFRRAIREAIGEIELQCRVVLGNTRLSFAEVLGLDIGDVIKTNASSDSEAKMFVGDVPLYPCRPRAVGRRLAAVIYDDSTGPVSQPDSEKLAVDQLRLNAA